MLVPEMTQDVGSVRSEADLGLSTVDSEMVMVQVSSLLDCIGPLDHLLQTGGIDGHSLVTIELCFVAVDLHRHTYKSNEPDCQGHGTALPATRHSGLGFGAGVSMMHNDGHDST